jgi:hypothetical protein
MLYIAARYLVTAQSQYRQRLASSGRRSGERYVSERVTHSGFGHAPGASSPASAALVGGCLGRLVKVSSSAILMNMP